MLYGLDAYPMAPMWKAASALGATLFGAYLPDILVHNAAQKRREAIRKSLPDALDLMVLCAEAGRSEERRVGKECVSTSRSRWSPCNSKKTHMLHVTNTTSKYNN